MEEGELPACRITLPRWESRRPRSPIPGSSTTTFDESMPGIACSLAGIPGHRQTNPCAYCNAIPARSCRKQQRSTRATGNRLLLNLLELCSPFHDAPSRPRGIRCSLEATRALKLRKVPRGSLSLLADIDSGSLARQHVRQTGHTAVSADTAKLNQGTQPCDPKLAPRVKYTSFHSQYTVS